MATIKKVKKAQSGYSATANRVDSLRAVGAKQLGTPEGEKTLKRLKVAEAQEKKEDAMKSKKKKMKMGGMVKKACKGTLYPKSSSVSSKLEKGGSLGMKSVKAGFDKNPGVTRADVIVAAKGQAKKGKMVKKSPMMKKGGKMTKKCAYGCK